MSFKIMWYDVKIQVLYMGAALVYSGYAKSPTDAIDIAKSYYGINDIVIHGVDITSTVYGNITAKASDRMPAI